jgi:hypothetical protein
VDCTFPFRRSVGTSASGGSRDLLAGHRDLNHVDGLLHQEGPSGRTASASGTGPSGTGCMGGRRLSGPPAKKGTFKPVHSRNLEKFCPDLVGSPVASLIRGRLESSAALHGDQLFFETCVKLVAASLARSTWKRYNSELSLWKRFCVSSRINDDIRNVNRWKIKFIVWGWESRGLTVSTIKAYLGALKKLDQLVKGFESGSGNLEGALFKGMENLKRGGKPVLPETHPVSVPDLRRIRDGLKFVNERLTGQTVWTCCLVAFWGAFRLGELLGKAERAFDRFSDLLWGDLELNTDRVVIKIKAPKTRGPPGNRAILFKIPDPTLCPVTALNRLHAPQQNLGLLDDRLPVFRKTGGKILTLPEIPRRGKQG